eukprot:3735778-Heterocapsa_arctica.AAC.1
MKPLRNFLPKLKARLGNNSLEEVNRLSMCKNTISAPHDKSDGSAITSELRTQQKKLSRMKNIAFWLERAKSTV